MAYACYARRHPQRQFDFVVLCGFVFFPVRSL